MLLPTGTVCQGQPCTKCVSVSVALSQYSNSTVTVQLQYSNSTVALQ